MWKFPALLLIVSTLPAQDIPEATPESQGLKSDTLCEMSRHIRAEMHDIRSVLILRHGEMVLEWYAADVSRDHNHNLFSITKSVVATLAGIAINQNVIPSTSTTLGDLFPNFQGLKDDPDKLQVSLENLLTMRSGFPVSRANKSTGPERALFDRIQDAPDRLSMMLDDLPLVSQPGLKFEYNNIDPALVVAAVERRCGRSVLSFAESHLFEPLRFENAAWIFSDKTKLVPGGYGLRLRAIDLAKIGQMYLQNGDWNGRNIVASEWIQRSTSDVLGDGYGYFWWIDGGPQSYAAKGVRGQRLVIHPGLDLVYVILSDLPPESVAAVTKDLGDNYILKAITSDQSLPDDPDAKQRLDAELKAAQNYRPEARRSLPPFRLPQKKS